RAAARGRHDDAGRHPGRSAPGLGLARGDGVGGETPHRDLPRRHRRRLGPFPSRPHGRGRPLHLDRTARVPLVAGRPHHLLRGAAGAGGDLAPKPGPLRPKGGGVAQRPVNVGLRFSRNAATPSRASSVENAFANSAASISSAFSIGWPQPWLRARLAAAIAWVGPSAHFEASAIATLRRSSPETTLSARPMAWASSAPTWRPE